MTRSRRRTVGRPTVEDGSHEARRRPRGATPGSRTTHAIEDPFFRHIVAAMRNGVLAISGEDTLAFINDEAYRILGVAAHATHVGGPIAAVLDPHPEVMRALRSAFELHLLPNRAELRLRPSGTVIGYTVAAVRNEAGVVTGAAMFFKDLTRVDQLEERERLRDRLAAVGEMAAAIAHEVRNPLAGIEVMAGLLRRKITDDPDAQAVLTDIINEAKMANDIVQDVLEFVRPIRLQVERTAVAEAVQAAVQMAETKARRGTIDVTVDLPADLPQIQGDRVQLTQLFTNLLINAFEAMDGHGRVTISAKPARMNGAATGRDTVLVEVADDGPGIPQDVANRVFEPFFTTKPQGSGLGLGIVRKIVDAHDGQIDLRTAAGGGTLIRIALPVSSDPSWMTD